MRPCFMGDGLQLKMVEIMLANRPTQVCVSCCVSVNWSAVRAMFFVSVFSKTTEKLAMVFSQVGPVGP